MDDQPPPTDRPPVACAICGMEPGPGEGDPPLAWSSEAGPDGLRWACPVCTRDHVRSIEGKLQQDWWDLDA